MPGLNGKLSEYHAAIGLALLDEWPERAARYRGIAEAYRQGAAGWPGRIVTAPEISSAYVAYEASEAATAAAAAALALRGVQTRRWYGRGLHRQPFFAATAADPLPVSHALGARHLGLPAAIDLKPEDVALVTETVQRVLSGEAVSGAGLQADYAT